MEEELNKISICRIILKWFLFCAAYCSWLLTFACAWFGVYLASLITSSWSSEYAKAVIYLVLGGPLCWVGGLLSYVVYFIFMTTLTRMEMEDDEYY